MTSSQTGSRYERETVRRFRAAGWGALRIGASGSGGDADLPDVFCGRPHPGIEQPAVSESYCIELKSGKATTLYVQPDEVEALERFADNWGSTPLLGARFTTQASPTETLLVPPERARMTDGGAYGLPVDGCRQRATVAVSSDGVEWLE